MSLHDDHNHHDDQDYIHPLKLKITPYLNRRQALASLASFSLLGLLVSCSSSKFTATDATTTSTTTGNVVNGISGTCSVMPTETEGPYPANGSNSGANVLANSSIYRKNITDGKTGVPLILVLNLQNTNLSCAAISNAAVYIWHCDKDGSYSGYSSTQNGNHASESFLRGVQVSDTNGQVTFTTIYPGWYPGRITHIHFEIFLNNDLNSTPIRISQLGFPQTTTSSVYSSSLYSSHGQNSSVTSFAQDNVFSDGVTSQIATIAGDITNGFTATMNVGIGA